MKVSGKAKEMNSFSSRENIIRGHAQKLKRRRKPETDKYDWFTSCGASGAMIFFSTPSGDQQALPRMVVCSGVCANLLFTSGFDFIDISENQQKGECPLED